MNRLAKLVTLINLVLFAGLAVTTLELLYQGWPDIIIQQGQHSLRYEAQTSDYLARLHRRIEEQDRRIRELDDKLAALQERMAHRAAPGAQRGEAAHRAPVLTVLRDQPAEFDLGGKWYAWQDSNLRPKD